MSARAVFVQVMYRPAVNDVDASGLVLPSLTQRGDASGLQKPRCGWKVSSMHGPPQELSFGTLVLLLPSFFS